MSDEIIFENEVGSSSETEEAIVTPWTVKGSVDYEKLTEQFGSSLISPELLQRFERVTGRKPHPWLRRGFFYSHREFDEILTAHEKGEKFYLYTGRGPSSDSLHFGHLVPFMFTKWLQDVFDVPLVIQITGDEKYLFRDVTTADIKRYTVDNIKDIIAVGFDVSKTFIFDDFEYVGTMYPTIVRIQKAVTLNTMRSCFGFKPTDNVGMWAFPPVQAAPSFSCAFPHIFPPEQGPVRCLIPCAIDQDNYFRMTREIAPRLREHKPSLIHSKFFPSLQGHDAKMSSSDLDSAIFLTDAPAEITRKIGAALSGGGDTLELHRQHGANLKVDIPFAYLQFVLDDDAELERIATEYGAGRMLTGEVKAKLVKILVEITQRHQKARASITDDLVRVFMTPRPLTFK